LETQGAEPLTAFRQKELSAARLDWRALDEHIIRRNPSKVGERTLRFGGRALVAGLALNLPGCGV